MKNWKESYKSKICTPDEAIQKIKDAKRISFGHICSESTVLTEALLRNKKLFKKLIDIEMKNTELMDKAKVSKSTFYKIKNGENVTTDVLLRICDVLECDISEIVECVEIEDK